MSDLERPKRCFSEPTTKISMKIDPYYPQHKCRSMTLVSENIRYKQIFVGFLWDGASNDSGIVDLSVASRVSVMGIKCSVRCQQYLHTLLLPSV